MQKPGLIGLFAYRYSSYVTDYYFDDFEVLSEEPNGVFAANLPSGGPPWVLQEPNNCKTIDVTFKPLNDSYYEGTLIIKGVDNSEQQRRVRLSGTGIPDYLQIHPNEDFEFSGHPGGPFLPSARLYTLNNIGPIDIHWTVDEPNWLDVDPKSGTVKPAKSVNVRISPNAVAKTLSQGHYTGDVNFVDITTGITQSRHVSTVAYTESKIWADPYSLVVTTAQGSSVKKSLRIGNAGDAALSFTFSAQPSWVNFDYTAGIVEPGQANDVNVTFNADRGLGVYEGQTRILSDDPYTPTLPIRMTMIVEPVDYFTEWFDSTANDVANRMATFVPGGSFSYYNACTQQVVAFPVDPSARTIVSLGDDDYAEVKLLYRQIHFYGIGYDTFYIGSNGYVTFTSGDTHYLEGLTYHFDLPRISALFDDLDPSAAGTIWWKQLTDRVVVTFEDVPEFSIANSNSFQIEIFYDGVVRITWLGVAATDGLVGISEGYGIPLYFQQSDLSECAILGDLNDDCDLDWADYAKLASGWRKSHTAGQVDSGRDLNRDGLVDIQDLKVLCEQWLTGGNL